MNLHYYDYSTYLKQKFQFKIQKISINAGMTCPNRDGRLGVGGCSFCNNLTFSPQYTHENASIEDQVKMGVSFFSRKYKEMRFLAYFQNYTNTYAPIETLISDYNRVLSLNNIEGLVIGTRPDCVSTDLLEYLKDVSRKKYVMIEYGVESTNDNTLSRINRHHNFETAKNIIIETAKYGIETSAHIILGLPGENEDCMLQHADKISFLPLKTIKLHQLQIIKDTQMAKEYENEPDKFCLFSPDNYIEFLGKFIQRLNPQICIERFVSSSPKELLVAPQWGLKNYEFATKLEKYLERENITQGQYFTIK